MKAKLRMTLSFLLILMCVVVLAVPAAAVDDAKSLGLKTLDGASAHICEVSGLRFRGSISRTGYDSLAGRAGGIETGLLIATADDLEKVGSFTADELARGGASFTAVAAEPVAEGENYVFVAEIGNITSDKYGVQYAARAYVRLLGEGTYIYADDYTVRSVGEVAAKAVDDYELGDKDGLAYSLVSEAMVNRQVANVYKKQGVVTDGLRQVGKIGIYVESGAASVQMYDAYVYSRYTEEALKTLGGFVATCMSEYTGYSADRNAFRDSILRLYTKFVANTDKSYLTHWMLESSLTQAENNIAAIRCFNYDPLTYSAYSVVDGTKVQLYWRDRSHSGTTTDNTGLPIMITVGTELQMRMALVRTYIEACDGLMYSLSASDVQSFRQKLDADYAKAKVAFASSADATALLEREYTALCAFLDGGASDYLAGEQGADSYFGVVCDFNTADRTDVTLKSADDVVSALEGGLDAYAAKLGGINAEARSRMSAIATQFGLTVNFD